MIGERMRTRGAVLMHEGGPEAKLEVVDLELDPPGPNEILVKMVASGLCHSDDHIVKGDLPAKKLPACCGHEGSGIVEEVGPGTGGFAASDHVVFSFLPVCGRCTFCSTGRQVLCENRADSLTSSLPEDPTNERMQLPDGTPVGQLAGLSPFAEYTTVNVASVLKVPKDLPLDKLCLSGCGVGS